MNSNKIFTVLGLAAALTVSAAMAQTPAPAPTTAPTATAAPATGKVAKVNKRKHVKHVTATSKAPAAAPVVTPLAPKK